MSITKKYFDLLCELRRLYKIEIVADEKQHDPFLNYEVPTRAESTAFLEFLRDELKVYSATAIGKLHLDRIILCKKLSKSDLNVSGCASMSLFPASLPMRVLFRKNTIYLAAEYCNTAEGRISIHHELFHAFEAHEDRFPKYLDPIWENLNLPAFRYREGRFQASANHQDPDYEGFLTSYSMETVREDKAELYAHMIVNMPRVKYLTSRDKFLLAKVQRLKQLLKAFSQDFNESFWSNREQNPLTDSMEIEYEQLLLKRLNSLL